MKLCACGCGQEIKIKKHHKYYGIPNYIKGHNTKGKSLSEKAKLKLSQNAEINPNYGMKGKHHSLKIVYLYAEVVIQKRIQIAKLGQSFFKSC